MTIARKYDFQPGQKIQSAQIDEEFDNLITGVNTLETTVTTNATSSTTALNTHKNANTLDHPDGSVTTQKVADSAITNVKLATNSVTNAKISDSSVTSSKLADSSVTTSKILDGSVTASKLAGDSVTSGAIALNSIVTNKIQDLAVTSAKISDGAITSSKLLDNSITGSKLSNGSVTADKLDSSLITNVEINAHRLNSTLDHPDGSVTTAKYADLSVTGAKIANSTITKDKLDSSVFNVLAPLQREIANLKGESAAKNKIDGASAVGYDFIDDLNDGSAWQIDLTKTTSTSALSIGNTSLPVVSITGFKIGQEITIYDDVDTERTLITATPSGNNLTVQALTKAFKSGAKIARTTATYDTTNKRLKFAGWDSTITNAVTNPTTVVASAYDTSGNGGRKLVRLSNGWLIGSAYDSSGSKVYFYKSTDNGSNWSQLTFYSVSAVNWSIVSSGTTVYVLLTTSTNVYYHTFNATTVTNTGQPLTSIESQTTMGTCSLAIDTNGKLWAAWASKNSTYPNSFNIRVSSSTDGGATWASPTQISALNTTGQDYKNPCIVTKLNGYPVIVHEFVTTTKGIYGSRWNGTGWDNFLVYDGSTFAQSNPCAVVDGNDAIHVVWSGLDSTDTTQYNIRHSKSADGGVAWSAMTKLTTGNTHGQHLPSITRDKNNNLYVLWEGFVTNTTDRQIRKIVYTTSWSSITNLTSYTGDRNYHVSTLSNYTDFSDPLTIWKDISDIKFRGIWAEVTTIPVLVEDVRYNVKTPSAIKELVTFIDYETDAGFSLATSTSIHATNANESYVSMTKTTSTVDTTKSEDAFTMNAVGTGQNSGTIKTVMTRTGTSIDKAIVKVLGGGS